MFTVVVAVGYALAIVIALQAAWAILRLLSPVHPRDAVRQIAAALADALRHQRLASDALIALQSQLRWPYPFRLRRAIAALVRPEPLPLVEALARANLMPPSVLATGRSAAASGLPAQIRWLEALAGPVRTRAGLSGGSSTCIATALLLAWAVAFLSVAVLPKFDMIFRDLGMRLPPLLAGMTAFTWFCVRWSGIVGPAVMATALLAIRAWTTWAWRRDQRFARGTLLVGGAADGCSEPELAVALAESLTGRREALIAAGERGDFPALARLAGWRASTPEQLAERVEHARWCEQRWRTRAQVVGQMLMPLLLAVPVGLLTIGIFQALTNIIVLLAESS
ncbi:MAG: hypothetical protein H0W72_18020 [Planctomycetes bacterium]|nr:hypothetical protein [Planctomycetota bacterium]